MNGDLAIGCGIIFLGIVIFLIVLPVISIWVPVLRGT